MLLEKLLRAVNHYVEMRREFEANSPSVCNDWDCGIANDLDNSFALSGHLERLESARKAMDRAFNEYVNARVAAALTDGRQIGVPE